MSNDPRTSEPAAHCVMCDGPLMEVAGPPLHVVWRCNDCGTMLTIPNSAWDVAAAKKEAPSKQRRRWTDRAPTHEP